jgi:hypothetical protein
MKARLSFAFAVLVLSLGLTPAAPASSVKINCDSYCATVRCIDDGSTRYVCGPYINSSGQVVCGCHPGGIKP